MNRAQRIGHLADVADSHLHLDTMPLPVQLDAYRSALTRLRDELRALFIEMTDENPWNQHDTQ